MDEQNDLCVVIIEREQMVASSIELWGSGGEAGAEGMDFGGGSAIAGVHGIIGLFEEVAFGIGGQGVGDAIKLREGEGFSVASDVFARKDDGLARFSGGAIGLVAMSSVDGVDGGHGDGLLVRAKIRRFRVQIPGRFPCNDNNNQPVGCHM